MLFASEVPDLREMYAKLLATSMDSATSDTAHPSFVTLIQQLTPDEARILRHLGSLNENWPCWGGNEETCELESAMRKMCVEAGIEDPVKADLYVENLLRLRILGRVTSSETKYHPEGGNHYGTYEASVSTHYSEFIEITCYGIALLEACVIDVVAHDEDTTP
jgi:hypothetical protein